MEQKQSDSRQDIMNCLQYYHPTGNTFEVRLKGIKANKSSLWNNEWASGVVSGYFNDISIATEAIIRAESEVQPEIVMFSINSVPDDYLARANNRFKVNCASLKDADLSHVDNILLDFDPVRMVQGVSATEGEKSKAREAALKLAHDTVAAGLPEPLISDSGNGFHVALKVSHLDANQGKELIKSFTEFAADNYGDEFVRVDTTVTSPAHMVRVIGTMNRKGENMPDRPHRRSKIISFPQKIEPIPMDRLVAIAQQHQAKKVQNIAPPASRAIAHGAAKFAKFNLVGYLDHYSIHAVKVVPHGDSTLYVLDRCLFDPSHGTSEAAIGQREDGTLFYQCFHTSCQSYRWIDAKQRISGNDSLQAFVEGGSHGTEPLVGTVVSMEELVAVDFPPTIPLIENIISVGGATVISGPGGVGKSNLTLNMALALGSHGLLQYLDLTVSDQVNTLIVQAENAAADTKDRLLLMAKHPGFHAGFSHVFSPTHNLSDIRILGGDFNDDKFYDKIREDIISTKAGLAVIDPLISFHRGDENDNSTMRRTLDRLTMLMVQTGVSIILVHHVGRANQSGNGGGYAGRGASAVGDWCHNSFLLRVSDPKTGTLELSCQKARNFKKPDPICMKLNQNLVFERVYPKGSFTSVFHNRIVSDALRSLGGKAKTQKELVDAIIRSQPDLNKTKAHGIIKEAVDAGVIFEITDHRAKTYELPMNP